MFRQPRNYCLIVACFLVCMYVYPNQTANIVVPATTTPGMGHVQVLSTLMSELVQRGHSVTLLSGSHEYSNKFSASNASKTIHYRSPNATTTEALTNLVKDLADVKFYDYTFTQQIAGVLIYYQSMSADCRALLSDRDVLKKLKSEKFDILIGDVASPCDIFIAHLLRIPWIAVTSNREYVCISKSIYRIPAALSYVPQIGLYMLTDKMSFLQRTGNVLFYFANSYITTPTFLREFVKIKEEFNIAPDMDVYEMSAKAEIWLSQTHLALDYPAPGLSNWVPVGGLGVRPPKALPQDLEEFVAGSGEHGFIVFSLGSIIKWLPDAPETSIIFSVLNSLPQRVVLKHDGPSPPNVGRNVKLLKWLPQNDLLGHPKVRLFIGHGGLNGIYEALHHAVPMVLIPLMFDDQKENAARMAEKGMGIHLDRSKLTKDIFMEAVTKILNDTRYKAAVTHYSGILRDKPSLHTAVHWIEHVLKFGGSHLRASVYDLNFVQYYLIDVAVFLLTIITVVTLTVIYSCRLCWPKCVRKHAKVD